MHMRIDRMFLGTFAMVGRLARVGAVFLMSVPLGALAVDDDYLRQLENEATKLDGSGVPAAQESTTHAVPGGMAVFEQELQGHYRGSYLFYKKLPRGSRQEIFAEYAQGASINDIRQTIMKKFLHKK